MTQENTSKGMASLQAAYQADLQAGNQSQEVLDTKLKWVLERADQYAKACNTTREKILEAWETKRTYWWVNFYQGCNQPNLEEHGTTPVVMVKDWLKEAQERFGKEPLDWKFACPCCGHVQSLREFNEAGLNPHKAYTCCASRFGLGGKDTCKYTTGGLIRLGRYVISEDFIPTLVFNFANPD